MTTQDLNELERDIEQSRARLDLTINRLQDKLSVSGVVDDVLGTMRANHYGDTFDTALAVLRRNPVPVMLVAAGVGWLIYRMGNDSARRRHIERLERERLATAQLGMEGVDYSDAGYEDPDLPAAGTARIYEPATSSPLARNPDAVESRPALNART
jgi:Protein of unknown function (DUF3618)